MVKKLPLVGSNRAPLPTTAAANEINSMARGMGMGDLDFAAVMDVIRSFSDDG